MNISDLEHGNWFTSYNDSFLPEVLDEQLKSLKEEEEEKRRKIF